MMFPNLAALFFAQDGKHNKQALLMSALALCAANPCGFIPRDLEAARNRTVFPRTLYNSSR